MVFTVFPVSSSPSSTRRSAMRPSAAPTRIRPRPCTGSTRSTTEWGWMTFVKAFEAAENVHQRQLPEHRRVQRGPRHQKALETSASLKQEDLRAAVASFSGRLNTLDGAFKIDTTTGAQVGELLPVAQFQPSGGAHEAGHRLPRGSGHGQGDLPGEVGRARRHRSGERGEGRPVCWGFPCWPESCSVSSSGWLALG